MTPAQTCPQCGASLPADAPASLCPACLLSSALPTDQGATMLIAPPKPHALPQIGEVFGGYRIERELGRGGMGAVYAAEQLSSGRRVALKVLSHQLDSPDARARFLREGRLAASINHPNSVYVFGTEEIDDTPVIAMELIAGGTLQDRIQRFGPLSIGAAVDAVLQIIAGLEAAHSVGILHRDIKPANCFEDLDGTVKIGDFGLSISTAGRGDSMQTMDGTFLGTPAFCSPEQLRGEELNVRSDMYSVGVTLFYLLTARTPFEGRNMVQQLASSLEKAAPSPLQYRPDIPQGLARIVLRCLNKQASERFATYQELQQALRPFASIAPTPATLGLRFAAGVIDHFILTSLCFVIPLLWVDSPLDFLDPRKFHTAEFFWIVTGMFAIRHLYFGLLEGIWGASAGKALVGLRVARLNRSAPGIPRALLRSLLLQAFATVELLRFNVTDFTQVTTWSYVWPLGQVLFFLLMFISVRRRNGFAALHDLWTTTRVIQKAAYHPRVTMTQAETAVSTTEDTPKVGPYHVLATLSRVGDQAVLLGYDTRLLRKVWIRQTPLGSPPVAQALRNIARPGRLRWLQGERDAHESWDAYEAASGSPLTSLLTAPQPWRLVRHWLSDLTAELDAATKTSSLPDPLTLDRVWITAEGRAKLLDFPAPGSVSNAPAAESMTAQAFLHQVAIATLEGRLVSPQDAATRTLAAPLPITARRTLLGLRSMADLRSTATQLQALTQQPAEISRWRRFALLFGTLAPSLIMTAFALVGLMGYQNWAAKNPALPALGRCMRSYESMQENGNPWQLKDIPAPEAKTAMETYIAETYRSLVQDAQQWESPMARAMLTPQKRAVVEQIVKQHPRPSPEQVSKAKALLKPLLDVSSSELNLTGKDHMLNFVSFSVLCVYLFLTALLSLFCAVVFRGGLVLRILGIAVVKNDGSDASRGRMLWRSLIAWSPILLSPVILFTLAPFIEKAGAQAMLSGKIIGIITLIILPLALGIAAIAMRGRGLHDRLARTWLVPR